MKALLMSFALAIVLTGCTSLSLVERAAAAWVLDKAPKYERELNKSLTGDEQLDEGGELSDTPTL